MFEFLDKLRARPESHRKAIAFGVSAIFTLFVFIGWSSTLDLSIGGKRPEVVAENNGTTANINQTANLEGAVSPFSSITDSLGAMVIDFKNHLDFSKKEVAPTIDKAHNPVPGLVVNPQDIK
jgi:hypothetical protein